MKFFLFFAACIFFAETSNAQTHADKVTEINFFTQEFSLNDLQIGKAAKIVQSKYYAYESFKGLKNENYSAYTQELKQAFDSSNEAIKAALVEKDQFTAFDNYQKDLKAEWVQLMQQYQSQGMTYDEANGLYYETVFFP